MSARRAYVAGPMRGLPMFNFPAFDYAAKILRSRGWEVISPAEHDREVGLDETQHPHGDETNVQGTPWCFAAAMRWDIGVLIDPATTDIVLLDGWEKSVGANVELTVARTVGLRVCRLHCKSGWWLEEDADLWPQRHIAA